MTRLLADESSHQLGGTIHPLRLALIVFACGRVLEEPFAGSTVTRTIQRVVRSSAPRSLGWRSLVATIGPAKRELMFLRAERPVAWVLLPRMRGHASTFHLYSRNAFHPLSMSSHDQEARSQCSVRAVRGACRHSRCHAWCSRGHRRRSGQSLPSMESLDLADAS